MKSIEDLINDKKPTTLPMSFTSSTIFTVISFLLIAVVFHNDNSAVFVVRGFSPSTTTTRHQNHHDSNISRRISIIALNAESDNNKMDEAAAKALTEFMAKAHDEKLRAIADVESKSKGRIQVCPSSRIILYVDLTFYIICHFLITTTFMHTHKHYITYKGT